ncbi:Eco57I restriction-modification methylase domain-containing protein [Bacteroidota bacterium]
MYRALDKSLRNELEAAVKKARDTAEAAAKSALEQLGVGEAVLPSHLSESEKDLRRRLRAHGRQFGDVRNEKTKTQDLTRLIEEVAYEHWHRMLFARFLAENKLLMYPDPDEPVAITLEECESLAKEEGVTNGWELAAKFAAKMLPQIFRIDSPVFELTLPPENQRQLEQIVAGLDRETFLASDSLGWVYQFWQAKRKEEVNKAEIPIGSRELPAVTQLFTEDYMVSFLLDNSLGAWWSARKLTEVDLINAESEEELRQKASIEGIPLEYLRFVKNDDGKWEQASGVFDDWPENLSELKILDPSCGSGHFLVAIFLVLVPMRMELEGLSAKEAVDLVLKENIHGLEIEQRCIELAAFSLALNAWNYDGTNGYRKLPELNLACSGLPLGISKGEWKALAGDDKKISIALDWMYEEFQNAPILGSLINPTRSDSFEAINWNEMELLIEKSLNNTSSNKHFEAGIVVRGLAKAGKMLADKYHFVITNVPYLARGKHSQRLRDYCDRYYEIAKIDLATVFLERLIEFCNEDGNVSAVLPQNWLTLNKYKRLRKKILCNSDLLMLARLGPGAFETIGGEVVKVILLSLQNSALRLDMDINQKDNKFWGQELSQLKGIKEKAHTLKSGDPKLISQKEQLENSESMIILEDLGEGELLKNYCRTLTGLQTGDDPRYARNFWEVFKPFYPLWLHYQGTPNNQFTGKNRIVLWENGNGALINSPQAYIRNRDTWTTHAIAIKMMTDLKPTLFNNAAFDMNVGALIPNSKELFTAVWAFVSSNLFSTEIRKIDKQLKLTTAVLGKINFDYKYWDKKAKQNYPNGLPNPFTNEPTQWIFHGHPCGSVIWDEETKWTALGEFRTDNTVLQIAVARLLGYRWPAELDKKMELADEQREWVNKCEELLPYADEDGIVCIPAVRGESTAADRLLNLLAASYSDQWGNAILDELLTNAGHTGKTLDSWLREKFFTQHCKLFQHRPFIWHIWDGLTDGFSALVNYHKLDAKLLETLIYTYLGDWITRQREDLNSGMDGAAEKLAAAELLKKSLQLILEGEAPYDIFVRWKPIEEQPIGWNPDLNDGVRLNIRPFMSVPDVRKKGAGVLRDKPNIKWNKDRGTNVPSAPWYKLGLEFGGKEGDRINEHHLILAEKLAARKEKSK